MPYREQRPPVRSVFGDVFADLAPYSFKMRAVSAIQSFELDNDEVADALQYFVDIGLFLDELCVPFSSSDKIGANVAAGFYFWFCGIGRPCGPCDIACSKFLWSMFESTAEVRYVDVAFCVWWVVWRIG